MERGAHGAVRAGDVLTKVDSGGIFVCREPEVDQARHDRFEVSITGPIFGPEMRRAEGEPAAWEEAVLAEAGLGIEDFGRMGRIAPGTRRALRAPVREASAEREGEDLIVRFTLPPGSYGTVLLGEVVKA
jgi:tRNA pseudouridine13 synthase